MGYMLCLNCKDITQIGTYKLSEVFHYQYALVSEQNLLVV